MGQPGLNVLLLLLRAPSRYSFGEILAANPLIRNVFMYLTGIILSGKDPPWNAGFAEGKHRSWELSWTWSRQNLASILGFSHIRALPEPLLWSVLSVELSPRRTFRVCSSQQQRNEELTAHRGDCSFCCCCSCFFQLIPIHYVFHGCRFYRRNLINSLSFFC